MMIHTKSLMKKYDHGFVALNDLNIYVLRICL